MLDFINRPKSLDDRVAQAQLDAMWPRTTAQSQDVLSALADLGDLDLLDSGLIEPEEGDGLLKLTDEAELSIALWLATSELGREPNMSSILDRLDHEREHADAISALGLRAVYALRFKKLENGELGMKSTTIPVGGHTSKLGLAAMLAHPRRLSNSDMRQIRYIGYRGPVDIADRIRSSGSSIPLPLSRQ